MNTNNIDLITGLIQLLMKQDLASRAEPVATPFLVGQTYLIRTATMIDVGRVKAIYPGFLVLEDAAWVADTGRFYDALTKGTLSEVEPFPADCIVALGGIIDAAPWAHPLPREQK